MTIPIIIEYDFIQNVYFLVLLWGSLVSFVVSQKKKYKKKKLKN